MYIFSFVKSRYDLFPYANRHRRAIEYANALEVLIAAMEFPT